MTTTATLTAACGCKFTGRRVESDRCTVIDHATITGSARVRHATKALKSLKETK